MTPGKIVLLGGSGFIGCHIAELLCRRGVSVTVATRRRERAKRDLIVLPMVDVVEADVHRDADLDRLFAGADAVVNLVGILHASRRNGFERAHAGLPARVVDACARAGVRRLVHMSALGASADAPSRYLRSKAQGEAAVRAASDRGIAWTIFRPSVVFGRGDSFLTLFASLLRVLPVVLLGSPNAKFQPIWVEDVARAFVHALFNPSTAGRTYELCGPRVYTLRELIALVGEATGHRRPVIGLGERLSWLQAAMMELSPVKVLTRDNLLSMKVDNVCGCDYPAEFGASPTPLEAVIPDYLGARTRRDRGMLRRPGGS